MNTRSRTRKATITKAAGLAAAVAVSAISCTATANADNKRLNDNVFSQIYAAQKSNKCPSVPRLDGRLVEAAKRHSRDVTANPALNADAGSDGSTAVSRAADAGFVGKIAQTVAINPALAISGTEVLNIWWNHPPSRATMQDCSNTSIGVWSENSFSRSVVVAVYGQAGTL